MEEILTSIEFVYAGKIGIDNLLLMLVGFLYYYVYTQNKHERLAYLHQRTALFFLLYGFLFDLYRLKSLRFILLMHTRNYQLFKTGMLLLFLVWLYDGLMHAIIDHWKRR